MRAKQPRVRFGMRTLGIAAATVAAAVSAAVPATGPADSTSTNGAPTVGVVEYNLGDDAFTDRRWLHGFGEMRAVVHYPEKLTRDKGTAKLPVVVLQHGNQVPCYSLDAADRTWPCPRGVEPYPSNRGLDYLGEALATSGFVVVSPSANGINNFMGAASQNARMIAAHLRLLQQLSTTGGGPLSGAFTDPDTGLPKAVDFSGVLDLSRVGVLGHSTAGEAAMYLASEDNRHELPAGVSIKGALSLASPAPSGFFSTLVTDEPIAVVSSGCWSRGNEMYFQQARAYGGKRGFLLRVRKANHNFYNTEWTVGPGPTDGDDSGCPAAKGRPTAEDQRQLAVTYARAFFRYALYDDYSGLPILTGDEPAGDVETDVETY